MGISDREKKQCHTVHSVHTYNKHWTWQKKISLVLKFHTFAEHKSPVGQCETNYGEKKHTHSQHALDLDHIHSAYVTVNYLWCRSYKYYNQDTVKIR